MLDIRIVCVDYYMSSPTRGLDVTYSSFRISPVKQVPVIRVFGITTSGVKACIHIHGVFPYIYIPYDGTISAYSLMVKIAQDIDQGINIASSNSDKTITRQHVFKITLVSGVPFYGYHAKPHQFFKIYFYNPNSIKKAVKLLESGSVCNMVFQPHEAHIPYILQFFIDYNLYGMSFMKLSSFKLRHLPLVPNNEIRDTQELYRTSYCELEGDTIAENILNKISPEDREGAANPGLASIWEEERLRRIKEGKDMDSMIQTTQTVHNSQPTESDEAYRQQLHQAIQTRLQINAEETSQIGYAAETPDYNNLQDASFRDNHNLIDISHQDTDSQNQAADDIFNEEDLELIQLVENLMGGHHSDNEADQDSILGSQLIPNENNENIDENDDGHEEDLTLPFSPVSSASIFEEMDSPEPMQQDQDQAAFEKTWSPWEETFWSGVNLSQLSQAHLNNDMLEEEPNETEENPGVNNKKINIDFVDGNIDSSSSDDDDANSNLYLSTPKKMVKLNDTAERYKPLNISVQRSPGNQMNSTPPKNSVATPKKIVTTPKRNIASKKYSPKVMKSDDNSDISAMLKNLQQNASQINEKLRSPKQSQSSSSYDTSTSSNQILNSFKDVKLQLKFNNDKIEHSCKSTQTSQCCNCGEDTLASKRLNKRSIEPPALNKLQEMNEKDKIKSKLDYKGFEGNKYDEPKESRSKKKTKSVKFLDNNLAKVVNQKELNNQKAQMDYFKSNKISGDRRVSARNLRIKVLSGSAGSSKREAKVSKVESSHVNPNVMPEKQNNEHNSRKRDVRKTLFPVLDLEKISLNDKTNSSITILDSQGSDSAILLSSQTSNISVKSLEACDDNLDLTYQESITSDTSDIIESPQRSPVTFNKKAKKIKDNSRKKSLVQSDIIEKTIPDELNKSLLCKENLNMERINVESLDSTLIESQECTPEGIISFYDKTINPDLTIKPFCKTNVYTLNFNPPSRFDVLNNMLDFGLTVESGLMPFYGNPRDSSTSKEVGVDVIKLPSCKLSDLEEFIGDFGGPLFETKQKMTTISLGESCINGHKIPVMSSHRKIVITPAKKPPTYEHAVLWKEKLKPSNVEMPVNENVKGILEMAIFGGSLNESQSLTLTPCTPLSTQPLEEFKSQEYNSHSTPVINKPVFSPLITPISSSTIIQKNSSLPPIPEHDASQSNSVHSSHTKSIKSVTTQLDVNSVICDINNATPENSGMFKMELQNLQDAHSSSLHRYTTLFVAEIHCQTRGELCPDPKHDAIAAIFYCIHNDVPCDSNKPNLVKGVIIQCDTSEPKRRYTPDCNISLVSTEMDLINKFITLVREWDPDIVAGYETEMLSWGYIIQRGYILGLNLAVELSRVETVPFIQPEVNLDRGLDVKLVGRVSLNVWRLMRHEVALMSYSFENIMYHVMHTRVSKFSFKTLTFWWTHRSLHYREFVIKYYLTRVIGTYQILDQLDFIGSTSELASLFGIQFYEVLSRGSQFRVESMMIRLAKLQNFVPVSPSIKQRAEMRAPACIPLVMEPKSRFYGDPVILLDFQSLYPSMMIAYNYCFSTCLGRMEHLLQHERFEFGCTELKIPLNLLDELKDKIHVSPVGIAFVTPQVRKGTISKMVEEILETRLMVKKSMKDHKDDKLLHRVLHARQLGLKLIANVTYGYTSANFSGRMPSVEVADSIVSKGRETLERVIHMVNTHPTWGTKVVYGDTDSVFVLCPGRTRQEAFLIGQEIADAATRDNPKPVKLKLEKVYQPCILQTKKRYVGFMYESPDQTEPVYDAKGIETVRRDGCPAVSKISEKSLKILFRTRDVSQVKDYVCKQMSKLFTGRINIQDVTFAKEYRGIYGYKPGACVPALKIAKEILLTDRRGEPRSGERVGYVVICGPPGVPLIRLTTPPHQLIQDPSLRINPEYYILKAILPPLDRCFTLIGTNVFSWYQEFPKKNHMKIGLNSLEIGSKKSTISQYFATMKCALCGEMTTAGICSVCQSSPHIVAAGLAEKSNCLEYKYVAITKLCESCCERKVGLDCTSLDCPVMYRRVQASRDLSQIDFLQQLSKKFLPEIF